MGNKFTEQRKKRTNVNATEDIAEKLYEDEELIKDRSKEEKVIEEPVKKGPGRPKLADEEREMSSTYSILLTDSIRDKMATAANARKISLKKYIVMLIEDDYKKNADKYEAFKEMQDKLVF